MLNLLLLLEVLMGELLPSTFLLLP